MSRRMQWENMRLEARSRMADMESTPPSENTPNYHDARGGVMGGSNERPRAKSQRNSGREGDGTDTQRSNVRDSAQRHGGQAAARGDGGKDDDDGYGAVRRLASVENCAIPVVNILEVPTAVPVGQTLTTAPPMTAATAVSGGVGVRVPNNKVENERQGDTSDANSNKNDNNNNNNNSSSVGTEEAARESSVTRNENSFMSLQIELAQEKKKNIAAEHRLLLLEKEIKVLRAENMRLASADAKGAVTTRGVTSVAAPTTGSSPTHLEQMVQELQDELQLAKQYTNELELRLSEKSSALERRNREVESKEDRIRQLERTIADELIRRAKDEPDHKSSKGH
ncbi:hypothetical protein DQ04_21011000, partial [Trypanosoma grayi]|uniref:hypothetical protein n=1 Tax=Trypanosoma grayi TaxID=71804 RepID=UPI0004F46368